MSKFHTLLLSLALTACTSHTVTPTSTTTTGVPTLGLGESVERHLRERYDDTRVNCGNASEPAFLCNGVLIRGTEFSTSYHSWDNSLNSHRSGGVSFSYLRRDSRYARLAYNYNNGYIFLPIFYAGNKIDPDVLCAFPIDAATNTRADKGCGAYPGVTGSQACQSQGIYTAQAWYNHYRSGNNSHVHQCGFDVKDNLDAGATTAFDAMIKGMGLISTESFTTQNELRLAVWPDGSGKVLPLEAFFYTDNSTTGRISAQKDQIDFKNVTGITVPVISVWLPKTSSEQATFHYLAADQAIPVP